MEKDVYKGKKEIIESAVYVYPYANENRNVIAEITLETDGSIDLNTVDVEIPALKYNKSWLFLLSADDCRQDAFSRTWAAINGKPISSGYFYNIAHLRAGDFPPDVYDLGKTLGSTDGTGNEVRFTFTATLLAELACMDEKMEVDVGHTKDYYRFYMKTGMIWDDVIEMLHYGNSMAFHDVDTEAVNSPDSVKAHYLKSQEIILKKLSGRGCKVLAEPNGNKTYVTAARDYESIQIMTAQGGGVLLYPFRETGDLSKALLNRSFFSLDNMKNAVTQELELPREQRAAVQLGVHGVDDKFVQFLLWINDQYGKDGDDSVWCTSIEEYYEYNYYRVHGSVQKNVNGNTLKLSIYLPSGQYFYYPSITLNVKNLQAENIKFVSSGDVVTGLSYGKWENGVMLNVDCRRFLVERATYFVQAYEANKTESNRRDAAYFVHMLKESNEKEALLKRIK